MLTLAIFIWLIAPVFNAWYDRKGRKPFYLVVNIFRGMAAILHGSLFIHHYENYWYDWWPVLLYQFTSFWIVFDLLINWFQKRKDYPWPKWVFYFDQRERDSGWTDKFFAWAGKRAYIATKIVALVLCIIAIILIYDRN